ncbi:MAG: hypothetical protein KF838_06415 [Phycisphaeraceae bacterium]|nr:MAG: hypothetical protein KF838_06415 [Phycisphaeraceae bacterium]
MSSELGAKGKASFQHAAEAFKAIVTTGECDAVAMDIEKFFDSIPHTALKRSWAKLLNKPSLPADDYAVFKAVTEFATVPLAQVRKARGLGKRRFAKERSIAMTSEEFDREIRKRGLINVNRAEMGIPQGLPISGLLANIVMFEIDEVMVKAAAAEGGSYRRYSDDILIIAPRGRAADLEAVFKKQLALLPLSVQDSKTSRVRFRKRSSGSLVAVSMDSHGQEGNAGVALQYLGLEFDGQNVLIRPQTLVKFGKRMRRSVDRARRAALRSMRRGGPAKINRRDLYARYSHLRPHPETPPKRRPRGSFMNYASHAADAVAEIGGDTSIDQRIRIQLRGQWSLLQRLIANAEKSLSAPIPKKSKP